MASEVITIYSNSIDFMIAGFLISTPEILLPHLSLSLSTK